MKAILANLPRRLLRIVLALNVAILLAVIATSFLLTPRYRSFALLVPKSSFSSSPADFAGGAQAGLLSLGLGGSGARLAPFEAVMKSAVVVDLFIANSGLRTAVKKEFIEDYRDLVSEIVQIDFRKDGTVSISVEDDSPAVAQQYAVAYLTAFEGTARNIAEESARKQAEAMAAVVDHARSAYTSTQDRVSGSEIDASVVRSDPATVARSLTEIDGRILQSRIVLAQLERSHASSSPELASARAAHEELLAARRSLLRASPSKGRESGSEASSAFALDAALARQSVSIVGAYYQAREKVLVDSMLASSPFAVAQAPTLPEKRSWPQRRKLILFGLMTQTLLSLALLGAVASVRLRRSGAEEDV